MTKLVGEIVGVGMQTFGQVKNGRGFEDHLPEW